MEHKKGNILGILTMWIWIWIFSCKEISEFYTKTYKYQYARPIGLMMSKIFDSLDLSGKDILIGVIDAGFGGFKENEFTRNLEVVTYRNFITNDTAGFFSQQESDHGTIVTKMIGGKNQENKVHGLAYRAKYLLAKSDLPETEPSADEIRLTEAVEWMLKQNVRLINISIGFTTFDNAPQYNPQMLNGTSTLCSRFLDSVLKKHPDLIIVVSAGNEGNKPWQYITFPADVKEVITVGSSDFEGLERYPSSGKGAPFSNYIKPEVCTYPAPPGNSHTAPIITGLIACLLEMEKLSRSDIRRLIIQSSSRFRNPDKETGYGVPDTRKIIRQIQSG